MISNCRHHFATGLIVVVALVGIYSLIQVLMSLREGESRGSRAEQSLQYVIIITRHGNRSPLVDHIPSLPYPVSAKTIWPYGAMELTNQGRLQMYRLGEKVRSLYNGFLDEMYYPENFEAKSTNTPRTLMSGEVLLAGLFPPKGFQVWNRYIPWQPIPLPSDSLDNTWFVSTADQSTCPRFQIDQNRSLEGFLNINGNAVTRMLNQIQRYVGPIKISDIYDLGNKLFGLWDYLSCVDFEGLSLPSWACTVYPEPVISLMYKMMHARGTGTVFQTRFLVGPLFQEIIGLFKNRTNKSKLIGGGMTFYSGHDYTIVGMREILGLNGSELGLVNPASAIIFELHRDDTAKGSYVKVLYIDGASKDLEPKTVVVPGCGVTCDLNILTKITKQYHNITDMQKECHKIYDR